MKSQLFYFFFALTVIFTQACDEIDNLSGGASAPEVTYASTTYEADFFEAGSSSTPTINWNGDQGTVSLGSNITGLSVNSTTGQLQWTKMLPPGTHNVEVVLSNSEGQVVVPVVIENPLRGRFEGKYDDDVYYVLIFDGAGNLAVEANRENNPDLANGTYEVTSDGSLTGTYIYDFDPDSEVNILGEFNQMGSKAELTGTWDFGGGLTGDYEVSLD
ncbi:MAG: hypothetical protein WA952_16425 [Lewinella sp.]